MRVLITGGGDIGKTAASRLVEEGHEVVLIEEEREVCERIAENLDMMVICGDATKPDILEKAEIDRAELVLALSGNDQGNLITALMAKEYRNNEEEKGKRVIVRLDDPAFNTVCRKLGFEEIVNPKIATANHIADMARRPHALEVSTFVGGSIRVYTAIIYKEDHIGATVKDLPLPSDSLAVIIQREKEFFITKPDFKVMKGDHLTIICEEKALEKLEEVFG